MDQKAWRFLRCIGIIGCPLVKYEDNQVAKQRGHEDYFRNKSKVDIQGLLEIAKKEERKKKMLKVNRPRDAWPAQSVENRTLDLGVVYSGPMFGIELT